MGNKSSKSKNATKGGYKAAIARSETTKVLNLSNYGIKEVPRKIWDIQGMKTMDLSKNNLASIELPPMEKLKVLNLSNNNCQVLGDCFHKMARLESLDLSNNRLVSLPDSIWTMPKLKHLNLSNNQLRDLGKISKLKSLERITLDNNNLGEVPAALLELPRLYELHMTSNKIKALPEDWSSAAKIGIVNFAGNQISTVPKSLFCETPVFRINLENNPCHPERWRLAEGFPVYVKRYKEHVDKGLFHGGKVDYDKFI